MNLDMAGEIGSKNRNARRAWLSLSRVSRVKGNSVNGCRFKMLSQAASYLSKQDLIRGGAGVFGLKIGAAALSFANGVLLARLLSLESYGIMAMVIAAATTLATLLTLGMPSLLTRELAAYHAHEKWAQMKGIVYWAYRNVLLACVAAAALALVWLLAFGPPSWRFPGILGVAMATLLSVNLLRAAVLRGLHQVVIADVPDTLVQPLTIIALIGLTLDFASRDGVIWATSIQLIGTLCALLLGLYLLFRSWPAACSKAESVVLTEEWKGPATIFFLIGSLSIVEGQLAVLLTGALAGPAQAGLFQASNRLVSIVAIGLLAVNSPLMPKLAAAWAKGDQLQSQALVTQGMKLGVVVAFTIVLPLLVFPDWFLGLFGQAYKQASTATRILLLGQLINAACGPCGLVLAMTGHQSKALWALTMAVVVNLFTNLWLTEEFGLIGAATAVTASLIIWNLLMVYWAWRYAQINTTVIGWLYGR